MTIQEIQAQLKAQGFEVSEAAIATQLQSLKLKPEDITADVQEIAIEDLAQAFTDEQNEKAIAPRKRTQKQAIAEIKQWFNQFELTFTESEIKTKLQGDNLDPVSVTLEQVQEWAEQIKHGTGYGLVKKEAPPTTQPDPDLAIAKSEATGMGTQPPVQQSESVEEIRIDIPAQAIANVENLAVGMILKIDNQVDAMATSVARLANNAPALFAYKLNQKIGMQPGATEAQSLAEHDSAWNASRSRINDLIGNIQPGAIAS